MYNLFNKTLVLHYMESFFLYEKRLFNPLRFVFDRFFLFVIQRSTHVLQYMGTPINYYSRNINI